MKTFQVEKIECPSRQTFLNEICPQNKPFVFKNGLKKWRAFHEWSFDFFEQHYGDYDVPCERKELFDCVEVSDKGKILKATRDRLPLKSLIKHLNDPDPNEKIYITEWKVFEEIPELLDYIDLKALDIFQHKYASAFQMYLGKQFSYTPIHYDRGANLTAQLMGAKEWVLFPPQDGKYLYHYSWYSQMSHFTRIKTLQDLNNSEKFPNVKKARRWEVEVFPGEIIYVPHGWRHSVCSQEQTLSLHFFFKNNWLYFKQLMSIPLNHILKRRYNSDSCVNTTLTP